MSNLYFSARRHAKVISHLSLRHTIPYIGLPSINEIVVAYIVIYMVLYKPLIMLILLHFYLCS